MVKPDGLLCDLSQAQRERLAYIDYCLFFHGGISRGDLECRFGVSVAAASRDLACYRGLAPDNMVYDGSEKRYRIQKSFCPIIPFCVDRVLSWLRQGFGEGVALTGNRITSDFANLLAPPSIEMLGVLARAIRAGRALTIQYLSFASGSSSREIVPLAFVDNGLRWHIRAYDRRNHRFGDFVVSRISSAIDAARMPEDCESITSDEQWNRMVRLEIVPHPGVKHPEAVEADYGMQQGVLAVDIRAAIAGYALARWNVDSSKSHTLNPARHHLWLRNSDLLRDVDSAALAPGFLKCEGAA